MGKINFDSDEQTSGQAVLISVIFFMVVSVIIIFGLINPLIGQVRIVSNLSKSQKSFFLAEAGTEDILYRLKNSLPVQASQTLILDDNSVTTEITDTASGKTITSTGDWTDHFRKIEAKVVAGVGVSFNYGVQSGNGGFSLDNNAGVYGNVYANGDITGSNNTFISGTAIAANSAALITDQYNTLPLPPTDSINFRNASASQDMSQSFILSTSSPINKVELYIKKVSNPSNATVRITNDSSGNPGGTLTTGTLSASAVTTNYGWVTVTFSTNVLLLEGNTYWLVIDNGSHSSTKHYTIAANSSYSSGQAKIGQYGGTWNNTSPSGLDGYFKIYLGGITSTISDITVGSDGVGNAHANKVNNSVIHGDLYCKTGSGNQNETGGSISCNTSIEDPQPLSFPISEGNILQWKNEAQAGGVISGNYTPPGSSSSLGPVKIEGNLTLSSDHTLTITGTIWVTGNISMPNNDVVQLSAGYGNSSGLVISDGFIVLGNNVDFYGSGQSGSYIFLLSTSGCPLTGSCSGNNAIELNNNVGQNSDEVVVYAHNGTINFNNNAQVKEVTAYKIHLSNNVTIVYETGLASVVFSSGPGGAFQVVSWRETE